MREPEPMEIRKANILIKQLDEYAHGMNDRLDAQVAAWLDDHPTVRALTYPPYDDGVDDDP